MQALVRRPGPRLAEGIVTHIERAPVDVTRAYRQWEQYVAAFAAAGWEIVEVPRADDHPDAVFIEDAVVAYGRAAIMTRPGAAIRRAELPAVEEAVSTLGLAVERIRAPATLDGGDVLQVRATVYVGQSRRTNAEGVAQLAAILAPLGGTVVGVPVSHVLHLKSAVTALPDGTVIGYEPLVDDPTVFERFLPMPEESGAHVVVLDEHRVLMAADCPRSAATIRSLGYEPVLVDIGEFEKLEGCVTCLSVRVRTAMTGPRW